MAMMINMRAIHEKDSIVIILMILMAMQQDKNSCKASIQINHPSATTQNNFLINEIPKERMDKTKFPKDQTLVVRLPSNTLLKYNSYKDVSILHFYIPPDTRKAMFTFKAIEESKSSLYRKCNPREVSLHLKASSYPVISPENITFPRNFLSPDQRYKIYNMKLQSDEVQHRITVDGPQVGNWFAVAFISWTDPNTDRIEQQGLAASCDTLLLAEMSVSQFHPIIISNGQLHNSTLTSKICKQYMTTNFNGRYITTSIKGDEGLQNNKNHQQNENLQQLDTVNNTKNATKINTAVPNPTINEIYTKIISTEMSSQYPNTTSSTLSSKLCTEMNINNEIIYKFFVPQHIGVATAHITFGLGCLQCPDVRFNIQANAFPIVGAKDEKGQKSNYIHSTIIKSNQTGEISIDFYVQPMTWHYAVLKFVSESDSMDHATSSVIPSEQVWPRKSDNFQRKESQKDSFATIYVEDEKNTMASQKLSFGLHVDYHEQSDYNQNSVTENECSKTTCENYQNSTTANDTPENSWKPKKFRGIDFYAVLRQTYREFFTFDYDLMPDKNGTVPTVLNLTAGMTAGFSFNIGELYDIGGTLSFAVSMKHGNKASDSQNAKSMPSITSKSERRGILAEKFMGDHDISFNNNNNIESNNKRSDSKNLPRKNQTIIVCMSLGEPGKPTWPDRCRYGQRLLPASSIVNNTETNFNTGLIHVPFPESGQWYITMGLYCHDAEIASHATIIDNVKDFVRKYAYLLENMRYNCACASKFLRYRDCLNDPDCFGAMNETDTLTIKDCLMDSKCTLHHLEMTQKFEAHHKFTTEHHFALDNCSTSVAFTISSSPCIGGRCGRYGRCYHYMSGGFVFSTCVCTKGYRGWDCTEESQVPSSTSILIATLLLTLSNLLFFPSIYMAGRRQFYTEAIIYFFAMFFSIFYHACDSGEDEYSFCLVKIGVLQFCDFYCGLLAIWVTLVAMSYIQQQFVSLLHMLGAILLAFGTELNKQSLWVFLAPALTGICLISASWGMRCYMSRKCFPARKYLTVYMPLGAVLAMMGLTCYSFLQTKQNYHIVHSIWHMVMALSILCLLPSRLSFIPKC